MKAGLFFYVKLYSKKLSPRRNFLLLLILGLLLGLGAVILGPLTYSFAVADNALIESTIRISVCGDGVAEGAEQCDNNDLRGKTCQSFGFSGATLSCFSSCEFNFSDCTIPPAESFSQRTFSVDVGGTHTHQNINQTEASFTFPTQFFTEDIFMHVFSYETDFFEQTNPAPGNRQFVGNTYNTLLFSNIGDPVPSISKNVVVKMSYLNSDIEGLDEAKIRPYHYNENDSEWHLVPGSVINFSDNSVTFSTNSFSLFALFSVPPTQPTVPTPQAPSGGGKWSSYPLFRLFLPRTPPVIHPDFNSDGRVDIVDLSILLYRWGQTGPEIIPYDLNRDGVIDIVDVSILFYHWTEK